VPSVGPEKTEPVSVQPFTDVSEDAWYYDSVLYACQNGLMRGVSQELFVPNGGTTRAMVVTILYRLEGQPTVSGGATFADVLPGQWYSDAVAWAQSTGVVFGYSDTAFGPQDLVTREQIAAILFRYTARKNAAVSVRSDLASFKDAGEISAWASDSIQWANAVGMINGRTPDTIVPRGTATRAELAAILMRFCEYVLR